MTTHSEVLAVKIREALGEYNDNDKTLAELIHGLVARVQPPMGKMLAPTAPDDEMLAAGQEAWITAQKMGNAVEDCIEARVVYAAMMALAPDAAAATVTCPCCNYHIQPCEHAAATVEAAIPPGWVFYSADFSSPAIGTSKNGYVCLTRDMEGRKWWHSLDDMDRDQQPLYATGRGPTFSAALAAAVERTRAAQ